jgi:hypothetical protein
MSATNSFAEYPEKMKHPFEENIIDFYEYLLLGPLTIIYSAKKKTKTTELKEF